MTRKEKLLQRFAGKPRNFTWDEFTALMENLGYEALKGRGSARRFFKPSTGHKIFIHEPHPGHTLKAYQITEVLRALQDAGEMERQEAQ
jgi:predicted RNA binding protein YcfA (HicA-like mRNA interferase family)